MIDIAKLEEMSSKLIYNENHKELIKMETFLKTELDKVDDIIEKEYVLFLYLVVKIKHNPVETDSISNYFKIYFTEIQSTKEQLKNYPEIFELYLLTVISHLQYLKRLYVDKFFWWIEEKIYILKNDLKKDLYFAKKQYFSFLKQFMYKFILWYGRSYYNLIYSTIFIWIWFAIIYYINDITLLSWTLYSSFLWSDWHLIWPFDYYLYLSLNTLSNLWADFWLWTTPFLRTMFGIEQMIWVIFTWLFIYVLAKKV